MKWIALAGIPICGLLWSMGGDASWLKELRRFGVPITVFLMALLFTFPCPLIWLAILAAVLLWVSTTIGYGIPDDPQDPHGDDGSPLGQFWYKQSQGTHSQKADYANFMTRLTVGLAYGGSVGVLAFLNHWWMLFIGVLLIICITVWINALAKDPGPILGLNGREIVTGLGIGLGTIVCLL
jgi:hypothetical protein